jgi:decaprenylphospho-beta-D-ribofuranose 2-oxidase
MNKEILSESKIVSGWGLYKKVKVNLISNYDIKSLQEFIKKAPPGTVITRGIGRSYGDAAQLKDEYVVNLSNFNTIQLDLKRGLVLAG